MNFSEPLLIIKAFSKREYMEDFLNGNLYMNNLSFFRKEDISGELRDDALEGVTLVKSSKHGYDDINGWDGN
ncbi:hypothetical protein [Wohlfahrtiimonas populi]|uniref:hypothetical protein n=1 Tax=Wohlfahrtiimonas populi TaxID=1940240 RepID=UPI00098D74F8|nr:hypothetical protein [Wohlfahrtiimonas populi]